MSNVQPANMNPGNIQPRNDEAGRPARSVHVKQVPVAIWCKARQNALASGLSFKDYVIQLLASSGPVQRQAR